MSIKHITVSLIFLLCFSLIQAQVIKSEKSYLKLGIKPKKETVEIPDTISPELRILSPTITEGTKFESTLPELNLIGRAIDESSIASVIINSEISEITETGMFSRMLLLEPGENIITIIVLDNKNNSLQNKFLVEYTPPEPTLAEIVEEESKYYGFIIGIDNYDDPAILPLDNPITDAEKIYEILTGEYIFEKENVKLIKDARRRDIVNALDEFADLITPNDNLLIFYAGHGWWDEEANIGYWLPSDARRNSKADWFRNSTLVDYLKEIKSKHTLLITDACFGGSIFKSRSAFPEAEKAIQKLYELPSRKAMTSGTTEEVPDRSSFIKFLCERLTDNTEKYLSSEQLFSSIRIAVINNSDAVPQYGEIKNVGDQGGEFIFIKRE